MKTTYLKFVLKSLTSEAKNLISLEQGSVILTSELAEVAVKIKSYLVWLKCLSVNQRVINSKRSLIHYQEELHEILSKYEGLIEAPKSQVFEDFLTSQGKEVADVNDNESERFVEARKLEEMVSVIVQFNFYSKYKKYFPDEFKSYEAEVAQLASDFSWPVRGSWNAFSGRKKVIKEVVNNDFLNDY